MAQAILLEITFYLVSRLHGPFVLGSKFSVSVFDNRIDLQMVYSFVNVMTWPWDRWQEDIKYSGSHGTVWFRYWFWVKEREDGRPVIGNNDSHSTDELTPLTQRTSLRSEHKKNSTTTSQTPCSLLCKGWKATWWTAASQTHSSVNWNWVILCGHTCSYTSQSP